MLKKMIFEPKVSFISLIYMLGDRKPKQIFSILFC